jgi:hypothetical protein
VQPRRHEDRQTDGFFATIEMGIRLNDGNAGRVVVNLAELDSDFITHTR